MAASVTLDRAEAPGPAPAQRAVAERPAQRLFEPGGPTLEELILEAWGDLADGRGAECPLCRGRMAIAGGCSDCGSELS